jgi:hypothetical protein
MNTLLKRLAARLLPEITAEAACTETFYEYSCKCVGCGTPARQIRRGCRYCNGAKACSAWTETGKTCSASCC